MGAPKRNFRAPFRPSNEADWQRIRRQILAMWAAGYPPGEIGQKIRRQRMPDQAAPPGVAARTARQYFARIYEDYGLPPNRRTPAAALARAYALGDLPCPHPGPAAFAAKLEEAREEIRHLRTPRRRGSARRVTRPVTPVSPTGTETYGDRMRATLARVRSGGA